MQSVAGMRLTSSGRCFLCPESLKTKLMLLKKKGIEFVPSGVRLAWLLLVYSAFVGVVQANEAQFDAAQPVHAPIAVVMPGQAESNEEHVDYFVGLLERVLEVTAEEFGVAELKESPNVVTQARAIAQLSQGIGVDVLWTMTSSAREEVVRPIKVPLIKGLMGKRVFLIRQGTQPLFDQVDDLASLKKMIAGQGIHWPDSDILEANGLPLQLASRYELLFPMLKAGRYDYFPRGLHEAHSELEKHPSLALEQRLMLEYPAPMYFFVHPDNDLLAERIEKGLLALMASGDFDAYFNQHPVTAGVFERVNADDRLVIPLQNPLLSH